MHHRALHVNGMDEGMATTTTTTTITGVNEGMTTTTTIFITTLG